MELRPLQQSEPDTQQPGLSSSGTGSSAKGSRAQRTSHTVTFDLDADEQAHFVLTEALSEFASIQRHQAEHDPDSADSRHEWANLADELREQVEAAL